MLYKYKATVQRVVDGDTIDFLVGLGFRINYDVRVRLIGINAPERNALGGSEATDYLKAKLPIGKEVFIETFKNPTDKYGRWLATIYLDEVNLNQLIIADGHAIPFMT
jgi:micrococcal nuclease